MRLRNLVLLPLVFCLAHAVAQEAPQRLTKEAATPFLSKGDMVPNTRSPDKKIALWWIHPGETTAGTTLVWGKTDRSRCLNIPDIWKHAPDRANSALTVLWRADSSLVAFHDATAKHSRLQLLAFAKDTATAVPTPDLAAELSKETSLDDALVASGAVPVRWDASGHLEVRLRGKTRSGKSPAKTVFLQVKEGRATLAK